VGLVVLAWYYAQARRSLRDARPQVKIGTRGSALAMIQTEHVAGLLRAKYPLYNFVVTKGIQAHGDQVLNIPLKDIVVKTPGLFTKELGKSLCLYLSFCLCGFPAGLIN